MTLVQTLKARARTLKHETHALYLAVRDPRTPWYARAVAAAVVAYALSPIDLIPDFIPIVGSFDDAIVAALALRFVLRTTDGAVVRGHWHGDPATLERLLRLVSWGGRGTPRALP